MLFALIVISMCLVFWIWYYMISFNFMLGDFSSLYSETFQSEIMARSNYKLIEDYSKLLNSDTWNNDYICNGADNDCEFRWLYGFIPPWKTISLWSIFLQPWNQFVLESDFSWNLSLITTNLISAQVQNYSFLSWITLPYLLSWEYSINIWNTADDWAQYSINLSWSEWIIDFISSWNYITVSKDFNYYYWTNKVLQKDFTLRNSFCANWYELSSNNCIIDKQTTLLLHFDWVNWSSTFTDNSQYVKPILSNSWIVSNSQSKFGSASLTFGSSWWYLSLSNWSWYNFSNNDITIDFWIYPFQVNTGSLIDFRDSNSNYYQIWFLWWNICLFSAWWTVWNYCQNSWGWSTNLRYHLAVVKKGSSLNFYRNGNSVFNWTINWIFPNITFWNLIIGSSLVWTWILASYSWYVDELRISKWVARWISDFIPYNKNY